MTDIFRQQYKALDESTKTWMLSFKEQAQTLYDNFESCLEALPNADKRLMEMAKSELEKSIMCAIKSIT